MIVKTVKKQNGTTYTNYICSTHKKHGTCRNNNISVKTIEKAVLFTVQSHVNMFLNTDEFFEGIGAVELQTRKQNSINNMIERNLQVVRDNRDLLVKTCEHLVSGVITEDEYRIFATAFNNKIAEAENNIVMLRKEHGALADNKQASEYIERFKEYGNITKLTRRIVVTLLKSIVVNESKDVSINLRYIADIDTTHPVQEKAVV